MERVAPQLSTAEYPLHAVTDYIQGGETNDGSRHEIATRLMQHDKPHPAQARLDEPLWTWNGSLSEPSFSPTENPIINTSFCSPQATVNLATGIIEGKVPCAPEIKDSMLERIGATFFAGATPRALMADFGNEVGFVCKDDEYPSMHVASARLFFGAIATGKLLAFDVHDITHHAVQLQRWPEFYTQMGAIGHKAFENDAVDQTFNTKLARPLIGLVVDAAFEESLIDENGQLHSFGCLNWLSPRDTPISELATASNLSDEQLLAGQRWHALYALKDLYRTQYRASEELGMPLDWVERLGYDADERFKRLSELPHPTPLASLDVRDAAHIEVKTPGTPDELLNNATVLFKDLGLWSRQTS